MPDELRYIGLVEIGRSIRERKTSSVESTRAILRRIERLDGQLKSYALVTPEIALAQAAAADAEMARGVSRGPLHGVPVAVKDLCRTAGVPTAAGMAIYKDYMPERDATVVAKLKQAGAVLLGKLQMTEGAFSVHHPSIDPPVNPWDPTLWTGVSSSGSGVATAAGLCYGSLGSDTLGSIRFPSTMNGLTGLKPTWGRVSRAGVFPFAETLDHIGPMTRSAIDAAAMLAVIAGSDPDDPTAVDHPIADYLGEIEFGVRGLRIGIDRSAVERGTDVEMARVADEAAKTFAGAGALLREVTLPNLDELARDAVTLCAAEAAAAHESTFPERAGEYGPVLAKFIETGRAVPAITMAKIVQRRALFGGQLAAMFRDVDCLLLPTMNQAAPKTAALAGRVADHEARIGRIRFTAPFNLSGSPCLTLMGGMTRDGFPLGFQLIGRHYDESLLLRAGHLFQQATDWHKRHPT